MEVDSCGRGVGKTYHIVDWLKKGRIGDKPDSGNRVIITFSYSEKKRIISLYNLTEKEVLCLSEKEKLFGRKVELGIDNLDLIIEQLFRNPVNYVTLTESVRGVVAPIAAEKR